MSRTTPRRAAPDRPELASTARTIALVRPAAGRLALATLLGAGAVAAAIALLVTSAWLLSRAAQHPPESALAIAVVLVQCFALSRGLLRYAERLVGHDAAFGLLAAVRRRITAHLERLAPTGLPAFRSGDLLTRVVADVDGLDDLVLRVVQPFAVAAVVGTATVAFTWSLLPGAGAVLLVTLVLGSTAVPWVTGALARRREARRSGTARRPRRGGRRPGRRRGRARRLRRPRRAGRTGRRA